MIRAAGLAPRGLMMLQATLEFVVRDAFPVGNGNQMPNNTYKGVRYSNDRAPAGQACAVPFVRSELMLMEVVR